MDISGNSLLQKKEKYYNTFSFVRIGGKTEMRPAIRGDAAARSGHSDIFAS